MSEISAQRFMSVSTKFGANSSRVKDLSPTALYLLAAPNTSETDRPIALLRLFKAFLGPAQI